MKKILLTGSSGFLGSNITPLLKNNYEVFTFRSDVYDLRSMEDCKKLLEVSSPDIVIHAAGSVGGIGANKQNPGRFMYDNLSMGSNLIECLRQYGKLDKLILLGTVCCYPKFTPVPFKEDDIWNGYPEETNAPYGIAKKALMQLTQSYYQQYGMKTVNLIPVNMYGPYDHFNITSSHVIPALIVKIDRAIRLKDKAVSLWGTGEASREFLYAPDCADAIIKAIDTDTSPNPINIGTGKEIKIKDLAFLIAEIMGYEGEFEFNTEMPDGQPRRCLDVSRAKDILGFTAKTDFKVGLTKTIEWYKNSQETE